MDYLVTWSINITADTPEEAARRAWRAMRRRYSTANVFEVSDGVKAPTRVDLTELDAAKAEAPHEPA